MNSVFALHVIDLGLTLRTLLWFRETAGVNPEHRARCSPQNNVDKMETLSTWKLSPDSLCRVSFLSTRFTWAKGGS